MLMLPEEFTSLSKTIIKMVASLVFYEGRGLSAVGMSMLITKNKS
tara:strand:+ start:56 stop:190 length:135 start_codon:yes stop_codon:yes gene_type:complete